MVMSRYRVGTDGKTSYERRRGRKCMIPLAIFGETVHYKKLAKEKHRHKFDIQWDEGVWLGHARSTNEALIGTPGGVLRAYACKRLPEGDRWQLDRILNMIGTPQRPVPTKPGLNIPIRVPLPDVQLDGDAEVLPSCACGSAAMRLTPRPNALARGDSGAVHFSGSPDH